MFRYAFALILALLFFTLPSDGQRSIPREPPRKPRSKLPAPPKPRPKPVTTGTLSIVTNPPVAKIIIKGGQGSPRKVQSQEGQYQTELPQGTYKVEVSADKYSSQTIEAHVERGKMATIRVQLTPTIGAVLINLGAVGLDATILVDGKVPTSVAKRSENEIELDDLTAGTHTLRITHPSIAPYEAPVVVEGGQTVPVNPTFKSAIANLLIRSEPDAIIFVDGRMEGRTTNSGELLISKSPGRHTVKAEKERFEPAETTDDFKIGDQTVEVKLTRIKSSSEFSDVFQEGTTYWEAPKGWQVNRGKMTVQGQGIGFVRNKVYDDFKMIFDIRFTNQKGAVWIVRARDKKNYYLFQLSGTKASRPKIFRSYICQNGQLNPIKSDPVVEDLSRPNDSYQITIEAKGNLIKHFIQLKSNPAAGSEVLSILSDSTFPYGGIGFGAIDDEEFDVYFVNITPDSSSSH